MTFEEWWKVNETEAFYDICQEVDYGILAVMNQVEGWLHKAYEAGRDYASDR